MNNEINKMKLNGITIKNYVNIENEKCVNIENDIICDEKINEYIKQKQFDKLLEFNKFHANKFDKTFFVSCRDDHIIMHVINNIDINMEIIEMLSIKNKHIYHDIAKRKYGDIWNYHKQLDDKIRDYIEKK
jgi:hypothetical protein